MADEPDVERLCLDSRFVLMTDGEILPITKLLDDDGDECDLAVASACVAGRDGYGWLVIDFFDDGENETLH